jgi:hypothetical protein
VCRESSPQSGGERRRDEKSNPACDEQTVANG